MCFLSRPGPEDDPPGEFTTCRPQAHKPNFLSTKRGVCAQINQVYKNWFLTLECPSKEQE